MQTQTDNKTQAIEALRASYLKHAPNGFFSDRKACLGDDRHIYLGLIADRNDCNNNIRENDLGWGIFTISEVGEGFTLERSYHSLSIKPENPYHAMGHAKVPYRIIKAKNLLDLVKKWEKYLDRHFAMVKDEIAKDNLYYGADGLDRKYLDTIQ